MAVEDAELVRELKAVGLRCGVSDGTIVSWHGDADDKLAALVVKAHDQADGSKALTALKKALSTELWVAYVACRNRQVRNARRDRFAVEANPLKFQADELRALGKTEEADARLLEWLQTKATIRDNYPYPIPE